MDGLYGITTCYQEEEIQQLLHANAAKYLKITEHNSATTFLYFGQDNLLKQIIGLITTEYNNAMCDVVTPYKVLRKLQDFRKALCDKPAGKTFHFESKECLEVIKSKIETRSSFEMSKAIDSVKKVIVNGE